MNTPSHLLTFLKQHTTNPKLLNQILAQSTTTGLLQITTTTLHWNSTITAYSKSSTPIQAILIYNHLIRSSPFLLDHHTYPPLLKACTLLPSLSKAKELHAHLTKIGLVAHDIYVQNSLIHTYGSISQLEDAQTLFDEMPQRDVTTWNSILKAYVSSINLRHKAFILFKEMVYNSIRADAITITILLSGFDQPMSNYGRTIHAYTSKLGFGLNVKLGNAILNLYARNGDMEAAIRLFSEMRLTDVASQTIVINGLVELGLLDLARSIFNRSSSRDVVLWNSMINGYIKYNRMKEALELFHKMEIENASPDAVTMASLLSACSSSSDLQFGRSIHQFIRRRAIKEDLVLGTALVDMYSKCGSLEEAMLTFYKMVYKDIYTWTVVISGLATNGFGGKALSLFALMETEGIEPNQATFIAVLTACSHSGLVDEGRILLDRMVNVYGLEPTVEHLGCMVDLLSRAGLLSEAMEMVRRIPVRDRIVAKTALLNGCVSYGEVGIGEKVAKELREIGGCSHGVCVLLSNFYAMSGRWDCVEEMREKARRLEVRKEAGSSYVEGKDSL